MSTLTVTAKGQVTLKKDVLEHLGVRPGQKVNVEMLPDGQVAMRAAPAGKIADFFGFFDNAHGVRLTIDDINQAIADGWAGKR
jgi:bifunctional DNA-binding transcriptional regulator/antitoxin component of YhaV-PrlF toxin-antitoxin module